MNRIDRLKDFYGLDDISDVEKTISDNQIINQAKGLKHLLEDPKKVYLNNLK